jgi:hypothetical protein
VEHGAVDMIVNRLDMRDQVASMLSMLMENRPLNEGPISAVPEITVSEMNDFIASEEQEDNSVE